MNNKKIWYGEKMREQPSQTKKQYHRINQVNTMQSRNGLRRNVKLLIINVKRVITNVKCVIINVNRVIINVKRLIIINVPVLCSTYAT